MRITVTLTQAQAFRVVEEVWKSNEFRYRSLTEDQVIRLIDFYEESTGDFAENIGADDV